LILVTGASGFVGRAVCARLRHDSIQARAAVRDPAAAPDALAGSVVGAELSPDSDWSEALSAVSVVIHCAARVHVMRDSAGDPLAQYRRVNVEGTLNLARQAAAAGVQRFVFISSIKVSGEETPPDVSFSTDDTPAPSDPYGVSKWEAEEGLRRLAAETAMDAVIIRPPLVYGPGVKANFAAMMRWLEKGVPLPLGAIHNARSFVALENLIDLLVTCIDHPAAANQTFLVSDGEDLSTTQLLRRMGDALGKPARLLPVPAWMLEAGAAMLGKRELAQRLCGNLQVDITKTRDVLGWTPPVSVDEGLRATAAHYLAEKNAL